MNSEKNGKRTVFGGWSQIQSFHVDWAVYAQVALSSMSYL